MMSMFWIATCWASKNAFVNKIVLWWLLTFVSVLLEYIGMDVRIRIAIIPAFLQVLQSV